MKQTHLNGVRAEAPPQKRLAQELLGLLSPEEKDALGKPSFGYTAFTFTHIWLGLIAAYCAIGPIESWMWWYRIPASALLVIYIGTRLNALAVQVHEAAHHLLMRSRSGNDWFCNLFGAYWVLNDVEAYRRVHHHHHIHLHDDDDPDISLYRLPLRGGGYAALAESLLGITSFYRIIQYSKADNARPKPNAARAKVGHMLGKLSAQGIVLTLFIARFGWVAGSINFFVFWVIPLFSIMPTIIRLRIVAEHYDQAIHQPHAGLFVSRTTAANFLESYFIGADMQYHFEHHLIPSIPHHRLVQLHRILVDRHYFDRPQSTRNRWLSGGYIHFWTRLLSDRGRQQEATN